MLPEERANYLQQMNQAMRKIETGLQRYKQTKLTEDEEDLSNQLHAEWDPWLTIHKPWMDWEEKFTQNGLRNPWDKKAYLLSQGQGNSQEMQLVKIALELREKMVDVRRASQVYFDKSAKLLEAIINLDEQKGTGATRGQSYKGGVLVDPGVVGSLSNNSFHYAKIELSSGGAVVSLDGVELPLARWLRGGAADRIEQQRYHLAFIVN